MIRALFCFLLLLFLIGLFSLLHGCALLPDTVRPEIEHLSHVTQHPPFTDHPTRYGANVAAVVLHWNLPAHAFVEVGDGVVLEPRNALGYGEIEGPRETFEARVGVNIEVPK